MCSGCQSTWLVGLDEPVAQLRGRDVPRALGVVDERVARAPAVRVGVLDRLGAQQPPAGAEVLDEVGVGVLDLAPGVRPDALVVGPVGAHRVDDVQAVLLAEAEVVLAEGDRRVHEAGAVVGGDEVAEQDGVAALAVDVGLQVREGRLVAHAVERRAREAVEDPHAFGAEHALDERLGHDDGRVERARPWPARRRARGRPPPRRWRPGSTAWWSTRAARRRPAPGRRPRPPAGARRRSGRSTSW